jgi:Secretion system C-terminal sorting domain
MVSANIPPADFRVFGAFDLKDSWDVTNFDYPTELPTGGIFTLEAAWTFHGDTSKTNLEKVNSMLLNVNYIKHYYDSYLKNGCPQGTNICEIFLETKSESKPSPKLSISPNPATEKVTVNIENMLTNGRVKIINLIGQTIFEKTIFEDKNIEIDLKNTVPGIYFVQFQQNGRLFSAKFMVAK